MKSAWAAPAIAALSVLLTSGCGGQPEGRNVPFPEQNTNFQSLFRRNCSGCHGENGTSGPGPRLNDALYLAVADRDAIYNTIKYGRPGTTMPALGSEQGGTLTDQQISILVDGMRREWGRQVDFGGAPVPVYSVDKAPPGDAARGRTAYMRNCMPCHGYGNFKGSVGTILEPHYLALASDQGLRTIMIVGRSDWGMPDWRHRIPSHPMSDQEMSDVIAWLGTLRPKYARLATQGGKPEPHPPAPSVTTGQSQSGSTQER